MWMDRFWKVFRISTVRYNWPMSVHASQASIAHSTDSEDLPRFLHFASSFDETWHTVAKNTYPISESWNCLFSKIYLLGSYLWNSCTECRLESTGMLPQHHVAVFAASDERRVQMFLIITFAFVLSSSSSSSPSSVRCFIGRSLLFLYRKLFPLYRYADYTEKGLFCGWSKLYAQIYLRIFVQFFVLIASYSVSHV